MLSYLWVGFIVIAYLAAVFAWFGGDGEAFSKVMQAAFDMADTAAELALGLIGLLAFWLGLFRVAEHAGLIEKLGKTFEPLFRRLMPEVPKNHPAQGAVTLNLAANALGLDNAATPLGIKAMKSLQSLNTSQDTASNAQILFLVLNTSSVTLLPVTIFLYRAQQGATEPASVFLPILLATSASTFAGLLAVGMWQRLRLWDPVVLAYFAGFSTFIGAAMLGLSQLQGAELSRISTEFGNFILLSTVVLFVLAGTHKKIDVYSRFIEGARQGFGVALRILPYLVAMLVAIAMLRASGVMDMLLGAIAQAASAIGLDTRFVEAIPVGLMKPFSGSGARALWIELMQSHGVDAFPAMVGAIMQGSTETTFYVLAVYLGAVGIRKTRHAIPCALIADITGVVSAILLAYWFFA